MWQERQEKLLKEETEAIIVSLSSEDDFNDLILEFLTKSKQGLDKESENGYRWPLLPLIVCEAISGRYEHALPAASALHLLKTSAEIFDDIEDVDFPESLSTKCSSAVAINVATALIILAERGITRLERRGVEPHTVVRVMDLINLFYTTTCAGQHLDLSLTPKIAASEDVYLQIIKMKTASTVECACHVGALLATTDQELINKFSNLGHNIGMASQIANDILGITRGNDIVKLKITLPIIYALSHTDGETRIQLENTFLKRSEAVSNPLQIKDLLFCIGAIHYATIKMEYYKQLALDILAEVEEAKIDTERLKLFL